MLGVAAEVEIRAVGVEGVKLGEHFTQAGDIRLQKLRHEAAEDHVAVEHVADVVHAGSFGGIGVLAIPEMGRFYRHVLIEKRYPHHGAVAFGHYGKALFDVFRYLGIADIAYNQPKSLPYPTENPFA